MEAPELQEQMVKLCDDLRKEQEEKCRALAKAELLELEVEAVKESEEKMLEFLVSQTKQLEQTKISLEEAKLEAKHLKEAIKIMVDPKEVETLRAELNQALDAEEKSKKAMDDLAIALKEVTTESNTAQSELERLCAEIERLKSEAEDSTAAWRAKENGFINCIKMFEEEIASAKKENMRLAESKRAAREETSNLRDIVKQAVKETNAAKEALEMARNENAKLGKLISGRGANDEDESPKDFHSPTEPGSFDVGRGKPIVRFPSDNWTMRWNPMGDSKLLEGSIFDAYAPMSPRKEKDGCYDDLEMYDALDSPTRMRKKRQGIRVFGNMLRMRSFHK